MNAVRLLVIAVFALALPAMACAADAIKPAAPAAAAPSPFYGKLTLTGQTDYIPRGMSLTSHEPAVSTEFEVGYQYRLYGAVRVINTNFGDTTREVDVFGGIRPVLSPFVLDLGIIHYDYSGTTIPDFNEVYGAVQWPTLAGTGGQRLQLNAIGYWRTDNGDSYLQGDATYILAGDPDAAIKGIDPRWTISGRIAAVTGPLSYTTYGGALTYTFFQQGSPVSPQKLTGELRYTATSVAPGGCGTDICDDRLMFTLTYQSPLSAILPTTPL